MECLNKVLNHAFLRKMIFDFIKEINQREQIEMRKKTTITTLGNSAICIRTLSCFKYKDIQSVEWMLQNNYMGLFKYKFQREITLLSPLCATNVESFLSPDLLVWNGAASNLLCQKINDMHLFERIRLRNPYLFKLDSCIKSACEGGNWLLLKHLIKTSNIQPVNQGKSTKKSALLTRVEEEIQTYQCDNSSSWGQWHPIKASFKTIYYQFVTRGMVDAVVALNHYIMPVWTKEKQDMLPWAYFSGNEELIELVAKEFGCNQTVECLIEAIKGNHLDLLKKPLLTQQYQFIESKSYYMDAILKTAFLHGTLELFQHVYRPNRNMGISQFTCPKDVRVVRYVVEKNWEYAPIWYYINVALSFKDRALLEWLLDGVSIPSEKLSTHSATNYQTLTFAVDWGSVEILKMLHKRFGSVSLMFRPDAIYHACALGHRDALEWIYETYIWSKEGHVDSLISARCAILGNHVETFKFICHKEWDTLQHRGCELIMHCASAGGIELFQEVLASTKVVIGDYYDTSLLYVMRRAALFGNRPLLLYLLENYTFPIKNVETGKGYYYNHFYGMNSNDLEISLSPWDESIEIAENTQILSSQPLELASYIFEHYPQEFKSLYHESHITALCYYYASSNNISHFVSHYGKIEMWEKPNTTKLLKDLSIIFLNNSQRKLFTSLRDSYIVLKLLYNLTNTFKLPGVGIEDLIKTTARVTTSSVIREELTCTQILASMKLLSSQLFSLKTTARSVDPSYTDIVALLDTLTPPHQ